MEVIKMSKKALERVKVLEMVKFVRSLG